MKYQGSKSRIASDIIPIMLEAFSKNNCEIFIDCCVGGGNLLDKIPHSIERYGNEKENQAEPQCGTQYGSAFGFFHHRGH